METQITSPQVLTKLPRKKFCLIKKTLDLTTKTMPLFKKYAPKYARKVKIIWNYCPKTTSPRLKYLNSVGFYLYSSIFGQYRLKHNQMFKIIKHHKKYIQCCEGVHITPQVIKVLPQLRSYELSFNDCEPEEKYRVITFCRALKRLSFHLKYGYSLSKVKLLLLALKKNTYRILRALRTMRSIKELLLKFSDESIVSLSTFLQFFGSCPLFLSYLEFFSIDLYSCQKNFPEALQNDVNVKTALSFVSHLQISENILSEKMVFDHEILGNLTSLITRIKAKSPCNEDTIRKLSILKLLPRLKNLDLAFISYSKRMEKVFLESISLPKDIESVMLRLTDFVWRDMSLKLTKENRRIIQEYFEKHPRFQKFYSEWKSLNNLQTLKLIISNRHDERKCPTLTLKFAMGILRQMKNLKNLLYENAYQRNKDEQLPMDLRVFWESLKGSKKTLENLEIQVPDINFFAKKDMQGEFISGFSRLKSVEILGQIYWARNFGDFLNIIAKKSKEKVSINVQYLCFKKEKDLKDFFENLVKIPKNLNVELGVDVSGLHCLKWAESFCQFVARLRVEGKLTLKITEEVNKIRRSVFENSVFKEFIAERQKGSNFCVTRKLEDLW